MIRYRVALETADRLGTSGSKGWLAYRLGIETPTARVCITSEATLATAYTGSHHNCEDRLVVTADGKRYEIDHPDTESRNGLGRASTMSVFTGTTRVLGPTSLTNVTCTANTPSKTCTSGGPC
jgi:hypothetical protein